MIVQTGYLSSKTTLYQEVRLQSMKKDFRLLICENMFKWRTMLLFLNNKWEFKYNFRHVCCCTPFLRLSSCTAPFCLLTWRAW